ncbi:recombinase RecQ [Lysinibacillus yapensis]|uniref:Recombinase RecQ n=1 Tax=Ureibacillus yapensis TaxID=2304605 RepID=A0A396SK64_9BACL|nr:helix-turn-helix domain-containing protein [Lysinibacillus yapensis]RHW39397.1 recombinase RecQ [Lysinibacillus yapensis]
MIFQQILLEIFHKFNGERTISAPYHLLKGKRSGQTIQDVGIYHLHKYFGVLPKLARQTYDKAISALVEEEILIVLQDGFYKLTNKATSHLQENKTLPFDGWHYRGNEHLFFARLSLVVQSLSHQSAKQMSFIPIQKDEQVQQWVRHFLKTNHYQDGHLQQKLLEEIVMSLENLNVEEEAKEMVMLRLSGYKTAGLTWQQISYKMKLSEMDIGLIYISTLHKWLNEILQKKDEYFLLNQLTEAVRVNIPLSGSASQTAELFKNGYSVEEISRIRRLKMSTIEDHIVELAMNEPEFNMEQFVAKADIQRVIEAVDETHTRKLKVLHQMLPYLTYFQIRLVLARGERFES